MGDESGAGAWADWWRDGALDRLLGDLIWAEVGRMRPGRAAEPPDWTLGLRLGEEGLGLDSLERLRVAEAVEQALGLVPGDGSDGLMSARTFGGLAAEVRRLMPAAPRTLVFLTSGSTGRPRAWRHALAGLGEEVEHLASLSHPVGRVLAWVPSHTIYGFLFTVLLPRRLGVEVLDLRRSRPGALPGLARTGDLIVGTPTLWSALAGMGGWPGGVTGVTSGAPCPASLSARLRDRGLRILDIYGSTETAGIGWRDDGAVPFHLFPFWTHAGEDVLVRHLGGRRIDAELPDRVAWDGPNLLRPVGRRDGAVQVAGVNVWPGRVAEVLRAHPGVREARVRLMRPDEGDWLKVFVVPSDLGDDAARLRRDLDLWARERLSAPERPRAITLGDALPVTAAGKPGDWFIEG